MARTWWLPSAVCSARPTRVLQRDRLRCCLTSSLRGTNAMSSNCEGMVWRKNKNPPRSLRSASADVAATRIARIAAEASYLLHQRYDLFARCEITPSGRHVLWRKKFSVECGRYSELNECKRSLNNRDAWLCVVMRDDTRRSLPYFAYPS